MANKYVGAAQFVGEKIVKPIVKSFTKKQKTTGKGAIKKVQPGTELTFKRKQQDDFIKFRDNLHKGFSTETKNKLKTQNPLPKINKGLSDIKTPDEPKFNKGGRVGLKRGTGLRRPSNVEKIKKAFGSKESPQSRMTRKKKKFPDMSGDGKITQKDILIAKGVIPKPKKKVI